MPRRRLFYVLAVPLLLLATAQMAAAHEPCALSFWPHLFYSGFEGGDISGFLYNPMEAWGPGNNDTALEVQDMGGEIWCKAWIITGFNWTDHVLQASVWYGEGDYNNLGLIYHFQNPDNFYLFVLQDGNAASLKRMYNGTIDRSMSVDFAYEAERWYVMRIDVTGAHHRAVVNGEMVLEWDDATLERGTGGLCALGSRAWFDNVTCLIRPEPPLAQEQPPSVSLGQGH